MRGSGGRTAVESMRLYRNTHVTIMYTVQNSLNDANTFVIAAVIKLECML